MCRRREEDRQRNIPREEVASEAVYSLKIVRISQVEFPGKQILGRGVMCRMFIQESLGSTCVEDKDWKEDKQDKWSPDVGPTASLVDPQESSGARMVL